LTAVSNRFLGWLAGVGKPYPGDIQRAAALDPFFARDFLCPTIPRKLSHAEARALGARKGRTASTSAVAAGS